MQFIPLLKAVENILIHKADFTVLFPMYSFYFRITRQKQGIQRIALYSSYISIIQKLSVEFAVLGSAMSNSLGYIRTSNYPYIKYVVV